MIPFPTSPHDKEKVKELAAAVGTQLPPQWCLCLDAIGKEEQKAEFLVCKIQVNSIGCLKRAPHRLHFFLSLSKTPYPVVHSKGMAIKS
jgi:hypothetical protein